MGGHLSLVGQQSPAFTRRRGEEAWLNVGVPFVVAIVGVAVVLFVRQRDPAKRARLLRRSGFALMALFTVFFGLFAIGETFSDPGGWKALGLVALWVVPLAVMLALVWYRPGWATWLLGALIAVVIGLSVWYAINPHGWNAFEDRNGPIRTIVAFAVAVPLGLLGLKRAVVAGAMLLVLAIVPMAVVSLGHARFLSFFVVSSPTVVAGALYVLSVVTGRARPREATLSPS